VVRLTSDVEISVSNDGAPIPAGEVETIVEKYRRERSESQRMGNTGLGLYFCKRALEAQGRHPGRRDRGAADHRRHPPPRQERGRSGL